MSGRRSGRDQGAEAVRSARFKRVLRSRKPFTAASYGLFEPGGDLGDFLEDAAVGVGEFEVPARHRSCGDVKEFLQGDIGESGCGGGNRI